MCSPVSLPAAATPRSTDPVLYVDDARYARLWSLWKQVSTRDAAAQIDPEGDITRLLCREARLMDERQYDAWLSIFASECLYWIPRNAEPGDPRIESGIYLDDRRRLTDRVALSRTGYLHAQIPASRTRRQVSHIECWTLDDGSLAARANIVIWEHRKGITRAHPAMQVYEIVRDPAGAMVLAAKIVSLLDCDAPQGNYAFLL